MSGHLAFRPRVLLVESAGLRRAGLRALLEDRGYRVEESDDGADALHKALAWRPEAAVVAADVPPSDGYQAGRCLRAVFGPGIFLIGQSGPGHPIDPEQAREAGFDEVLDDADELADFFARLGAALGVAATPTEA